MKGFGCGGGGKDTVKLKSFGGDRQGRQGHDRAPAVRSVKSVWVDWHSKNQTEYEVEEYEVDEYEVEEYEVDSDDLGDCWEEDPWAEFPPPVP